MSGWEIQPHGAQTPRIAPGVARTDTGPSHTAQAPAITNSWKSSTAGVDSLSDRIESKLTTPGPLASDPAAVSLSRVRLEPGAGQARARRGSRWHSDRS